MNYNIAPSSFLKVAAALALASSLAACGYSPGERAVSGGLLGAGAGAVIGATVGAPLEGAAIGGAVGAVGGAATSPRDVNFGKPIWKP
jgi:osmotically inducible lipoprotein OsmB